MPCRVTAYLFSSKGYKEGALIHLQGWQSSHQAKISDCSWRSFAGCGCGPVSILWSRFRVGVATMAAARGMEDSIIEMLGRWSSVAYLQYVKSPENNCTASYQFQDPVCIESFLRCVQSNIDVFMTYSILIM